AVIGVLQLGRNAAARCTTGDFALMPPGPAARCAAHARGRSLRTHLGGDGVIAGVVPVAAPLVPVPAHVADAEAVLGAAARGRRPVHPRLGEADAVGGRWNVVAPWVDEPIRPAEGCPLPLSLGGQAKRDFSPRGKPR